MKPPLIVQAPQGRTFGLTMTPEDAGALLGLSDEAVREQCRQGVIPTMPRTDLAGASWRIPTIRLLDALGLPYEISPAGPGACHADVPPGVESAGTPVSPATLGAGGVSDSARIDGAA